ncbi:hypothetical protein GCM10009836_17410 [Pseudonocardia ailaonensis]|uniref:DUF3618 domain-containing protein n=1 Tax=Pseudonocardia ailaonensis TaxID=367279 RepID=A0ABN2MUJ3_9PSEU
MNPSHRGGVLPGGSVRLDPGLSVRGVAGGGRGAVQWGVDSERPVVDGTRISSRELRARALAEAGVLRGGHEAEVATARAELVDSLAALDRGLARLRAEVGAKVKRVGIIAGGVVAGSAALAGAAALVRVRAGKRAAG